MPKFYHRTALDALLADISGNVDSIRLLKAYSFDDSYSTVNTNSIAAGARTSGEYTLGDNGTGRQLASAAETGASASGSSQVYHTGTATAGGATTLTNSGAAFGGSNAEAGRVVKITGGTGSGQTRRIASNTGTVLTVDTAWSTNPDNTSTYQVLDDLHIAHVRAAATSRVLAVTDETSNQVITAGNTVDFPAHNIVVAQPT